MRKKGDLKVILMTLVVGWSEYFRNWDLPVQPSLGFTENEPKTQQYLAAVLLAKNPRGQTILEQKER